MGRTAIYLHQVSCEPPALAVDAYKESGQVDCAYKWTAQAALKLGLLTEC